MKLETVTQTVQQHIENNDWEAAAEAINALPTADIASVLDNLAIDASLKIFRRCQHTKQSSIFGYLSPQTQSNILKKLRRAELTSLFEKMDHDERADVYNRLSDEERQNILPGLAHAEREDIRTLASYKEGTIGSIMTSAYVSLEDNLTTTEALNRIRLEAPDAETIYQIYIIDKERHLKGTASLRDLMLAEPNATLKDFMITDVLHAHADEDRSIAAELIARYDLLALPIVDNNQRIVGIVTHDDAFDVSRDKSTKDQMRLGAVMTSTAEPTLSLKNISITLLYRMRVFWLIILVFGNIFSGAGIAYFEGLIERVVALVFFLPLLIASGGNAGAQSATLMVRAIATGDVKMRDWFSMLLKETTVSLLLGLSMAVAVYFIGIYRAGAEIAIVVSLSMVLITIVGSVIGMSLPFILTRFNQDPASASAPLVTTICDAVGILIYFNIAKLILDLPTF